MIQPGDPIKAADFRALIMMWPGATAPDGWLLCHGQAISRTTYAPLFAILGTTYGAGDGSTTFNLPDLRGSVVVGGGQKSKAQSVTFASTDVNVSTNKITLPAGSFLPTGQAVTFTGDGVNLGAFTGWSGSVTVGSTGWVGAGSNPLPSIDDIVAFHSHTTTNVFTDGTAFYVVERDTVNNKFRCSSTLGGSAITSMTAGFVNWSRGVNLEGNSGDVTYQDAPETLGIGNNTTPSVNDKVLITYDSSSSLNVGDIFTVTTSANPFTINSNGNDSGTNRWVKVPPTLHQAIADGDTYYVIDNMDGTISLATTFANAIAGVALDIYYAGTGNMTLSYTMNLTARTVGQEGGEEGHNQTVAEMASHRHNYGAFDGSAPGGSSGPTGGPDDYTGYTGGNQKFNVMQPFVVLQYIIKT